MQRSILPSFPSFLLFPSSFLLHLHLHRVHPNPLNPNTSLPPTPTPTPQTMGWQPGVFDPILIIGQLVAVTCAFYFATGSVLGVLMWCISQRPSLWLLLDSHALSLDLLRGWMVLLAYVAGTLGAAAAIRLLVARSKKALDFSASLFIFHTIISWATYHFPDTWTWWILFLSLLVGLALLSEYLCMRAELQDIPRGSASPAAARSLRTLNSPV